MCVRIAIVSDLHITLSRQGERPEYRARLARAVAAVNDERPDLVLIPGDLTDDGSVRQFASFVARVRAFRAPVRYIPGNHDAGGKMQANTDGFDPGLTKDYERALGPSFYSESVAGVRLIALNASLLGSGTPQDLRQAEMIKAEAARSPACHSVIMLHYPPFLDSPNEPGGSYWTLEPGPRQVVLDLAETTGARLVVSGHLHRPNDTEHKGTRYITAPSVAFGLPVVTQAEGWSLVQLHADGSITAENRYIAEPGPVEPYFLGRKSRLTELMQ